MILLSFTVIALVLFWAVLAAAYMTHRAYLRVFDMRAPHKPFSLRCFVGWHQDKIIATHNGFNLTRCVRCERPSMEWAPPAL